MPWRKKNQWPKATRASVNCSKKVAAIDPAHYGDLLIGELLKTARTGDKMEIVDTMVDIEGSLGVSGSLTHSLERVRGHEDEDLRLPVVKLE